MAISTLLRAAIAFAVLLVAQGDGVPIVLGDVVAGELAAGQEARYVYDGAAGAAIDVTLRATGGDWDPVLEIYAPSGALLAFDDDSAGGRDAAVRDLALPTDGAYVLVVRSYGNRSGGAYTLTLAGGSAPPTPIAGGGPIAFEQTVVGELTEGGQRDLWTFEGQSGQQVSIAMQSAEIDSLVTLNGPDGQEVAADDDNGGNRDALIFGLTLPETGAYTIVARAFDDYQTGRYRLTLMRGAATPVPATPTPAPTSVPAGALSPGAAVEGVLPAGATEAWTFAGAAGDVVSLALATAAFDAYLSVYGPDGALLAFDDDSGPGTNALVHEVALPAGGVYSVEVRAAAGYGGGAYTLTLYDQDTAPPPASGAGVLTPGETVTGALAAGQVDTWTFTLEAGATAALVATPTGGDLYQVDIDLASPAAGELAVGVNAVTHPLAEPGEYVVSIYAFGDQSGSYTLTLTLSDLPVVGGGAIGVGQSVEAHLEPGARDTWTLAGPHDAPVAIAMTALGATPFDTYLEVYAPDGGIVAMDDDGGAGYNAMVTALNLTAAGDYEIVARGYDATGGGMYRLEVFEMPTIALGETVTGALTDPEDSAIWAFTIAARTAVNVTVDGVGGFAPVAELHDPDGYFLVDDWETPIQNFPLNRPGTYTVVVAGYGEVGAFSLALSEGELPVDRGGPIAFGDRVAGALVTPGQIATWTFRAEAETVITVLLESPVFDTYLEVYDADGVLIAEDDDSAGGTNAQLTGFALPGAGEYRLVVRGYSGYETGAYELGLFRGTIVPKPPGVDGRVELGQTVEGAISAAGQRDTWRFTPQADSQFSITLRGDDAVAGRLYATVYDPDGYVIESAPAEDSSLNDIYAYVTGEYRAVVMALGGTGAYSLTYDRAILPPTPEPTLAGALSLGSEVAGSLEYGARHAWTLAVAEDVVVDITLRSSPPGALDTYLYLRDADGAALLSNDDTLTSTDSALVGVPLAGGSTYTVVAGSYADSGEGDYLLRIQPSPVMDLGETVNGELHPDGAPVGWALRVEAPAVVDIDARWAEAGRESDLWVQVYDTQRQYYLIDTTSAVRELQLGEAGVYYVSVYSLNAEAGAFTLTVAAADAPEPPEPPAPTGDAGRPIALGQTVRGEFAEAYQADIWAFSLGERATVQILAEGEDGVGVWIDLLDPRGAYLAAGRALGNLILQPGDYRIVVRNVEGVGAYTLTLGQVVPPTQPPTSGVVQGGGQISYGATVRGSIDAPGQRDLWRFIADAGDVVSVALTSADFDTFLELFDAAGNRLIVDDDGGGDLNAALHNFRLDRPGEYVIVARSLQPRTGGAYTLTLDRAPR